MLKPTDWDRAYAQLEKADPVKEPAPERSDAELWLVVLIAACTAAAAMLLALITIDGGQLLWGLLARLT